MSIERCNPRFEYETGLTMEAHPEGECVWYDDYVADIKRLRALLEAEKDSHTESLAMYRSARDRAERLQARVRELEAALRPIIEGDLGALPKAVLDRAAAALAAVSAEGSET